MNDEFSASTVVELEKDLEKAVQALLNTDCSSTTIRSASDLFKRYFPLVFIQSQRRLKWETKCLKHVRNLVPSSRFISLAPSNVLEQPIDKVLEFYESRGRTFITRVGESRSRIAKYSRPFFKSGMVSSGKCEACSIEFGIPECADSLAQSRCAGGTEKGAFGRSQTPRLGRQIEYFSLALCKVGCSSNCKVLR